MKKFSFVQDWGTYPNETFVVVGLAHKEILAAMRRRKFKKDAISAFAETGRPNKDETASAFAWYRGPSVLWFPEWQIDLAHYANLVHETNHLVFDAARDKGMRYEPEAQAYQQEYLFSNIVVKLNKFSGVKSKRKR